MIDIFTFGLLMFGLVCIGLCLLYLLATGTLKEPEEFKEMKRLVKIQEKEDERVGQVKSCHWCGFEYDKSLEACPKCGAKS
jgi:predicted Zn-ribbon and HTH transcriptional regulator